MDSISPSLLANIQERSKKHHERFCLGIGEWTESSNKSSAESEVPIVFARAFNLHAKTEMMTVLLHAFRCRSSSSVCRVVHYPW